MLDGGELGGGSHGEDVRLLLLLLLGVGDGGLLLVRAGIGDGRERGDGLGLVWLLLGLVLLLLGRLVVLVLVKGRDARLGRGVGGVSRLLRELAVDRTGRLVVVDETLFLAAEAHCGCEMAGWARQPIERDRDGLFGVKREEAVAMRKGKGWETWLRR